VPAFRHPRTHCEQLVLARRLSRASSSALLHDGLWPSEGSVSSRPCRSRAERIQMRSLRTSGSSGHTLRWDLGATGRRRSVPALRKLNFILPLAHVVALGREMVGFPRPLLSDLVGLRLQAAWMPRPLRRTCHKPNPRHRAKTRPGGRPPYKLSLSILPGDLTWELTYTIGVHGRNF